MRPWMPRMLGCAFGISSAATPAGGAWAQQVQIFSLSDAQFGTISSISAPQSLSQTLCIYSPLLRGYSIKATGSSSGGPFTISNGSTPMPYTVQWAFSGGQTIGSALTSGVSLSGNPGLSLLCGGLFGLLASNASLIITLPANSLAAAQAGTYTGTLSLMVSPN